MFQRRHRSKEMFYIDGHRFADRDLHAEILDEGDYEGARAISDAVALRLGLTRDEIAALHRKGAPTSVREKEKPKVGRTGRTGFTGRTGKTGLPRTGDAGFGAAKENFGGVAAAFEEFEHPREKTGSEAGEFAKKGIVSEPTPSRQRKGPKAPEEIEKLLNEVAIAVGGDEWNRSMAVRMEAQYQAVKDEIAQMADDLVAGTPLEYPGAPVDEAELEAAAEEEAEEEEELEPVPEEWDQLDSDQQENTFEQWKSANLEDFKQQEIESWQNGDEPMDNAKEFVAHGFNSGSGDVEWALDVIKELREERKDTREDPEGKETDFAPDFPYTDETIVTALEIDYESGTYSKDNPVFTWKEEKLQDPIGVEKEDLEKQPPLPGVEMKPVNYSKHLTKAMREEIEERMRGAFEKEAESKSQDLDPPDYLEESANEYMGQYWDDSVSDKKKFKYAQEFNIVNDPDAESEEPSEFASRPIMREGGLKMPIRMDPLSEDSTSQGYRETQRLIRVIATERSLQIAIARGAAVKRHDGSVDVDATRGQVKAMTQRLWDAWKGSSTSQAGLWIQKATAEEFNGRMRTKIIHGGTSEKQWTLIRSIVRGQWETTQWMLDKSGNHQLKLYRAVALRDHPKERTVKMESETSKAMQRSPYEYLPDLSIERNGAASTSVNVGMSNGWQNDDTRVVMRAVVPRTAAISVPAYGQNLHGEREVVVAGTAWVGWDAWRKTAPSLDDIPLLDEMSKPVAMPLPPKSFRREDIAAALAAGWKPQS